MADFKFDTTARLIGYYAGLPAANDALVFIPLKAAGLGADDTLRTQDTLAQVLSNAAEQTTMGRKMLTSTTVTVDKTNHRTDVDVADPTWTAPTGEQVGKLLVCYDPDTTTGTDADLVLLSAHDFSAIPNGTANIVGTVSASGIYRFS